MQGDVESIIGRMDTVVQAMLNSTKEIQEEINEKKKINIADTFKGSIINQTDKEDIFTKDYDAPSEFDDFEEAMLTSTG